MGKSSHGQLSRGAASQPLYGQTNASLPSKRGPVSPAESLVGVQGVLPEVPVDFAQNFLQAMIQGSLTDITDRFKR